MFHLCDMSTISKLFPIVFKNADKITSKSGKSASFIKKTQKKDKVPKLISKWPQGVARKISKKPKVNNWCEVVQVSSLINNIPVVICDSCI